jgi:uncharacterized protein (DUF427 family)
MVQVTLNGTVLADSADTVVVENNHYFPPSAVKSEFFSDSNTQYVALASARASADRLSSCSTVCGWKG